jgi:hypothetical protein
MMLPSAARPTMIFVHQRPVNGLLSRGTRGAKRPEAGDDHE